MSLPTIAIVGRPNVGKSTLFNRFVGGRQAIVDDRPGVTRDRNFAKADWAGNEFWLIDTGGWVTGEKDAISTGIRQQVTTAIDSADLILFVVDVMAGIHPADEEVAGILRGRADEVVLVANKMDDPRGNTAHTEFYSLGLGEPHPVSAATGKLSGDLLDSVLRKLPHLTTSEDEEQIGVAVIGRPNSGKSSIVNRLLGEDRSVVAPEAGTTRDAVDSPLKYHGITLNFIDTAGLRKKSKVADDIEFYSRVRTERAIERAEVAVLVVDAQRGLQMQELKIAESAWENGCGLIVAFNKWDLAEEKETNTALEIRKEVEHRAPFFEGVPFVFTSALTGQRIRNLLDLIVTVAENRSNRISTSEVNRVLEELVARNQPPQKPGKTVNIMFGSQIGVKPPTFALVINRPDVIPESYVRYLRRGFRNAWGFEGAPIRIKLKRKRKKVLKR